MFNKKKDKEVTLEIGLHPIQSTVAPVKEAKGGSSFMKWTLICGAIAMVGMVITGVVMKGGQKQAPALIPAPTMVSVPKVTNIPTTTPVPTTGVGDSTTGKVVVDPATSPTDGTAKPSNGYVDYKNFLLGVQMQYPSKWYVNERTNESLGVLNKALAGGKFNINETVADDIIQVADFTPSDKFKTKITITLVPDSKIKDKLSGVLKSTITDGAKLLVAEATTTKDVNGVSVQSINYVLEDKLKIKHNTTQMVFPVGKSFVVVTGTAEESGTIADKVAVMEEIIKSFKIS